MAVHTSPYPHRSVAVCASTDKTIDAVGAQDVRVSTRSDWPQAAFIGWLDGIKVRRQIRSDNKLAERWGIGHTLISGWRNGKQRPSIDTLNRIASAEEMDPRALWVLAGAANAIDVGLVGDDPLRGSAAMPTEFAELLETYESDELTDTDREYVRHHVRMLNIGVLADLATRRKEREQPPGRTG